MEKQRSLSFYRAKRHSARRASSRVARALTVSLLVGLMLIAPQAAAQAPGSPEWWPCVQRYVPKLSIGKFWEGGLKPSDAWQENQEIQRLAERFGNRDITTEESIADAQGFLSSPAGRDAAAAEDLVRSLQYAVNLQRDHVIRGIRRFAERQTEMIRRIERLSQQMDNPELTAQQIEQLETRQNWDIRVFEEREDMINYLCEQPVLLEKKFFAVGRSIAEKQNKRE